MRSARTFRLCFALVVILQLCGCASKTGLSLDSRHASSGVAMALWRNADGKDISFDDYVKAVIAAIAAPEQPWWTIPGESREERQDRIRLIAPHEWRPAQSACQNTASEGILLVHGLTDTPFVMRDLGNSLSAIPGRCFLIRSILLPGHGTGPGDLLKVSFADWQAAFRYGLESFRHLVNEVHLVGFSTGAALALETALSPRPSEPRIASVIVLSPLVRVHDALARIPLVPRLYGWQAQYDRGTRWLDIDPDQDFAKYESFPVNAAEQVILLGKQLGARPERRVSVPVFMVLAAEDQTVDPNAALEFFERRTSKELPNELLLYVRPELRAIYEQKLRSIRDRTIFVDGDLSHIATPVAPDNPHYGAGAGTYKNCLHYLEAGNRSKYCACLPSSQISAVCPPGSGNANVPEGETTAANMKAHPLFRRLTYNPKFDGLMTEMQKFLTTVQSESARRAR